MKNKSKPTIAQIAELSNVSPATVSMILSGKESVSFSNETIERVIKAAEQLSYKKKDSSSKILENTIAIICPNVSNPYYSTIVQSIECSAVKNNFDVAIYNTYRDKKIESRIINRIKESNISGVVFAMAPAENNVSQMLNIPLVAICDKEQSQLFDTVETDNFVAGVTMGKYLLELGHTNIAYVSTTLNESNPQRLMRISGIKEAFKNVESKNIHIYSKSISPEDERKNLHIEHQIGYSLCLQCLDEHKEVTTFVGMNDMIAYGIIDALIEKGYSIPDDYSVVGFDNNFPSHLHNISLTTIDQYMDTRGKYAFDLLHKKITHVNKSESETPLIVRMEFGHKLIKRSSTKALTR